MCPNINIKETRNEFNSIVEAFGGRPLAIEEFKSKELLQRNYCVCSEHFRKSWESLI
jgi:hypothetical protein